MLSELEQKRSFDIGLKLNFANLLFNTGDPLKGLANDRLRKEIRSLDDFVDYDLLIAKLSLQLPESDARSYMLKHLNIAKEKSPLNISVLWLS